MKIFGKIEEITQVILRKASRKVTIDPATQTVGDATLTVPDLAGVNRALVTDSSTQTLTNKTLTSPAISSPTGLVKGDVGLGNVDNTSDATKNAAAVTLTNKKLDDTTTRVVDTSDPTVELEFDVTGTTGTKTKLFTSQTANRNIVLPDAAGTIGLVPSAGPVRSSGTSLTTGAINLGSEVTGVLPIAEGGTGQTAPDDAFTALSPTTTTGDIIYRDGGSHDRLAIGSEGKVLTSVGGLPSWQFPAGGSGEINVIENSSAANTITGWVASGAGITVARTTTSSDLPLEGPVDSAIKITPVSGTDYVRYRWTMPAALKNKKLKLEWHQRPLSGYASGDLKVEVYKNSLSDYTGSYTEFALSTDSTGTSAIPNATGKYTTTYDADDADYYELRIVRVSGTTALNITNVISGPGIQPQGAVVGGWQSYSPTVAGLGTGSATATAFYRRNGDSMEIRCRLVKDGSSGSGSSPVSITVPSGTTLDTSKVPANTVVGYGSFSGATFGSEVDALYSSGTIILRESAASTNFTGADFTANGDINYWLSFPVSELAGSGIVNLAQADSQELVIAYNSSTDSGQALATFNTVQFDTEIVDTASRFASNTFTAVNAGYYDIAATLHLISGTSFSRVVVSIFVNGSEVIRCIDDPTARGVGVDVHYTLSQVVSLSQGDQVTIRVNASGTGTYSISGGSTDTRVAIRRISIDGNVIGFGAATSSAMGLVKGGTLPGDTTAASIASGFIGEVVQATPTAQTASGYNSSTSCASVSLTAGKWLLTATAAGANGTRPTGAGISALGWDLYNSTATSIIVSQKFTAFWNNAADSRDAAYGSGALSAYVTLTASATIQLRVRCDEASAGTGTPTASSFATGLLQAVRIG